MIKIAITSNHAWKALALVTDAGAHAAIAEAINETAIAGRELFAADTPGEAAESWKVEPAAPDRLKATIFTKLPFMLFLEYGTGVHSLWTGDPYPRLNDGGPGTPWFLQPGELTGRPNYRKSLMWMEGGTKHFSRGHWMHGQRPIGMIRNNWPEIERIYMTNLNIRVNAMLRGV